MKLQTFNRIVGLFIHSTGECGVRPLTHAQPHIVGGTEAAINAWPWQAMLLKYESRRQFCGGTLIDPFWVVTAAHCIAAQWPSSIFVRYDK